MKKFSPDPIAQFMQEHSVALVQLKNLNRAVRAIAQDGYSQKRFRQVLAALKFIDEEVGVHNTKEEEALFPVLERYVDGPTRVLRSDHKKLQRGFHQLRTAVDRVQMNRDSFSAIKRLDRVARDVVQRFVNHIHNENLILLPMVRRFLSKDELREIARKML